MSAFDTIVICLYDHFYQMHLKGRKISPWFQTAFTIALEGAILTSFIVYLLYTSTTGNKWHVSEKIFLPIFLVVGFLYFMAVKAFYFNTDKHIKLYSSYLNYSKRKIVTLRTIVISVVCIVPFLFVFLIWYNAK